MQTTALLKKEAPKGAVPTIGKFTNPLQRKAIGEEEEPLQMKQNPLQRIEDVDEELLQKKDNPLQLNKEGHNPLQLKQAVGSPLQLQAEETATPQPKKNNTGLPDNLKAGVEALSGYSMDDVKVHYNSDKPAQLQALAYAQGTDIHVAPGQEKHLPHEAWHVVQQKQGRVQPTLQMKGGIAVNDDRVLENEADMMGAKALANRKETSVIVSNSGQPLQKVVQRVIRIGGIDRSIMFLAVKFEHYLGGFDYAKAELTKLDGQNYIDDEAFKAALPLPLTLTEDQIYCNGQIITVSPQGGRANKHMSSKEVIEHLKKNSRDIRTDTAEEQKILIGEGRSSGSSKMGYILIKYTGANIHYWHAHNGSRMG